MRHCVKLPIWLVSTVVLSLGASALVADTPGHPYLGIACSNVFRLRPPALQTTNPPPALLPQVIPVGITTILGDRRVLLQVKFPARPPEPAREVSCILLPGQQEGLIQVLKIDEIAGSVEINNSGAVIVLTLAQDGPRLYADKYEAPRGR